MEAASKMPQGSEVVAPKRAAVARSRVTNGASVLPEVDGRRLIARRYRDIASALLSEQGDADQCSESRKQLIRRFAAAACLAERMEAQLANGAEININEHALLCSTLVRIAGRIGLDRVPKDISPTLGDLLREDLAQRHG